MASWSRLFARVAVLAGCLVMLTGWRIGPPLTYFEEEGSIATAIQRLRDAGRIERVLSIEITENWLAIEAQDPKMPSHVNRWRMQRDHFYKLNWEVLTGPEPVQLNLINRNLEENLFNISDVDFGSAPALIKDAVSRAALEDAASIDSMNIQKELFLLPNPSSGDIRWSVSVRSDRESARVLADGKGNFVRLDLNGTNRARTFDLLSSLELLPEAAAAFTKGVGTEPILVEVRVTSRGVSFETNISEKSPLMASLKQRQTFTWSLNGLERTSGSIDTSEHFGPEPPFSIQDVDWSHAGALVDKARQTLGMADAKIDDIQIEKPKDQPGTPRLEWQIALVDNGEKGEARFDAKGEPIAHTLPESRRKPFDGRDPATWPVALKQIAEFFSGEGAIAELVIHDAHVSIDAADPLNPKEMAQFLLDEQGIRRFGTASWFAAQNPRFSVSDLKALDEAQMRKLQEAMSARLGLKSSMISTITIGRAAMDPSPHGNVTVEIRAEEAPFGRGGRVNYEIDGREIKAYLP